MANDLLGDQAWMHVCDRDTHREVLASLYTRANGRVARRSKSRNIHGRLGQAGRLKSSRCRCGKTRYADGAGDVGTRRLAKMSIYSPDYLPCHLHFNGAGAGAWGVCTARTAY
jgi:hypothetical protein